MFNDTLVNGVLYSSIYIGGLLTAYFLITIKTPPDISFKYNDLDNYYIECMSLHRGTGHVIIKSDGKTELYCKDGHKPGDPHISRVGSKLLKSTPEGRLKNTKRIKWF